jgi:hypothetical protein
MNDWAMLSVGVIIEEGEIKGVAVVADWIGFFLYGLGMAMPASRICDWALHPDGTGKRRLHHLPLSL